MPSSIVFLLSTNATIPAGHFGRQTQAWFLSQVESVDPSLSAALHAQKRCNPYTISDLLTITATRKSKELLKSRSMRLLRLTLLDDNLAEYFIDKVLPQIPAKLKIWWLEFRLEDVYHTIHQHPLANSISYEELYAQSAHISNPRQVHLDFFSPTAFKAGRSETPLPLPGSVFHSLWDKWNTFCPDGLSLNGEWPRFAAENIVVRELKNINTQHLVYADGVRGGETGFIGDVKFELLRQMPDSSYPIEAWKTALTVMQSLSNYAFYAGVGHHTTIGLGQTRFIE